MMGAMVGKGLQDPEREASEGWLWGHPVSKIIRESSAMVTLLVDQT